MALATNHAAGQTISAADVNAMAVAVNALDIPRNPQPAANGLAAWSCDPYVCGVSGSAMTSGTVYLSGLFLAVTTTVTKVYFNIGTVGVTPTAGQNFVGIYDTAGVLKASAGIDATVTTLGPASITVTGVSLTPGMYWVALLFNAATGPQVTRPSTSLIGLMNLNLSGASLRYAVNGTARTTLAAPITPASNSGANLYPFWCAIGA